MKIIKFFNDRVKRLTIFDIKLIQGCAICVALILVKLIPDIMVLSIWWFIGMLVVFSLRPLYIFYMK